MKTVCCIHSCFLRFWQWENSCDSKHTVAARRVTDYLEMRRQCYPVHVRRYHSKPERDDINCSPACLWWPETLPSVMSCHSAPSCSPVPFPLPLPPAFFMSCHSSRLLIDPGRLWHPGLSETDNDFSFPKWQCNWHVFYKTTTLFGPKQYLSLVSLHVQSIGREWEKKMGMSTGKYNTGNLCCNILTPTLQTSSRCIK